MIADRIGESKNYLAAIFKGAYLAYISEDNKEYNKPSKFAVAVHDARMKAEEREANAIVRAAEVAQAEEEAQAKKQAEAEAAKKNSGIFGMFG